LHPDLGCHLLAVLLVGFRELLTQGFTQVFKALVDQIRQSVCLPRIHERRTSVVAGRVIGLVELVKEALEQASADSVDVLITDMMMPGMSGLELLGRLRKRGIGTPVILLTALGEGLHTFVIGQFTQFGTHLIGIAPGKSTTHGLSGAAKAGRSGRDTQKTLPTSGVLSTRISPSIRVIRRLQIDRPSPVPLPGGLVVKKGSNTRSATPGAKPGPLSPISISMPSPTAPGAPSSRP